MFRENSLINVGHILLLYVCIAGLYRNITLLPENKKENAFQGNLAALLFYISSQNIF